MTTTRSWMTTPGSIATSADLELALVGHKVTMIHSGEYTGHHVFTLRADGLWLDAQGNGYLAAGLGSIPAASPWHAMRMRLVHGDVA